MRKEESTPVVFDRRAHWENIYHTRKLDEVSWYQPVPQVSLELIHSYKPGKDASIMDAGGGHSYLVDHLLDQGFANITVLDISSRALQWARERLGPRADRVNWIESDVVRFESDQKFDLWHDRAAFHFLTEQKDIDAYLRTVDKHLKPDGKLIIGTFSDTGPTKCSGIEIKQYSQDELKDRFSSLFTADRCISHRHNTPSGKIQEFTFCSFSRTSRV